MLGNLQNGDVISASRLASASFLRGRYIHKTNFPYAAGFDNLNSFFFTRNGIETVTPSQNVSGRNMVLVNCAEFYW
jgi:hypothetical protein